MSTTSSAADQTPEERLERLRQLPPSAKLVFKVLQQEGELSPGDISDTSLLPARTTRYALNKLRDDDLVDERRSLEDPRRQLYSARPIRRPGDAD